MLNFFKKRAGKTREEENLVFREKYEQYRELLERNNEVLQIIGQLSMIRDQQQWISLSRLRAMMTRTAVNVYRLIQNLNFVTDNRYKSLDKIFAALEKEIADSLEARPHSNGGELALPLSRVRAELAGELGPKAAKLGEVASLPGIPVPPGVAFSALAYQKFLDHNQLNDYINKELLQLSPDHPEELEGISQRLEKLIMAAELPAELEEMLHQAHDRLRQGGGPDTPVVLRSSAVGEDEAGASFAGLYRSILNPPPTGLNQAFKAVLAGKFSPRVLSYFTQKGLYHELCPMGVLMMELVRARAGGVMFTRQPQGQGPGLLISAVWGMGKLAVEGSLTPDMFTVDRQDPSRIISSRVGPKEFRLALDPQGGTVQVPVEPELVEAPCLTPAQVAELARMGLQLEEHFGEPQDVEWSLDEDGRLWIVQCRPLLMETRSVAWSDSYPWQDLETHDEPVGTGLQVGSTGVACGPLVVMTRPGHGGSIPPGAVVMVASTSPDLVNLLPAAGAILAERGNPTGHLAIIAREFAVPLLIGFPLSRSDELAALGQITVDGYTGSVYAGRVEPLCRFAEGLEGGRQAKAPSALQTVLDRVLEHVVPLNLTNPRDPSFRAQAIRTIHDVIRFAHEQAINAMFEVNDTRMMRRGRVVRLDSPVPLDIYLIDLGGGISSKEGARKVTPEEITSLPMRALYEGMITPGVRWAGHVPIDFRGFMSVFANTMFDGAKYERRLGDRSYAIVSGRYVNFSSRLGYHFSIVDAFMSEEIKDNYISFRFKGGAAHLEKRVRRAQFLEEVLLRQDFWVDQKSDLVNARVKRLPRPEMEEKLRMLGRLMGCSRQLDVTMYNQEMVDRYAELFLAGDYSMGHGPNGLGEEAS